MKLKKILTKVIKTIANAIDPLHFVLSCVLIFFVINTSAQNADFNAEISRLKAVNVEAAVRLKNVKIGFEAKLKKVQKLNKVLLKQLDTKAEKVADVKTYITATSKTICKDVAGVIAENVVNNAIKYNVPVATIVSVMHQESHFNFQAIGSVGERGLMQVRHAVWGKKLNIKSKYDLHNIAIGIEKGVQVLDISLKECKYNIKKAIRQYNSGSTSRGSTRYVRSVMVHLSEYAAHTSVRQVIKDKQKLEVKNDDETKLFKGHNTRKDKSARTIPSLIQPGYPAKD